MARLARDPKKRTLSQHLARAWARPGQSARFCRNCGRPLPDGADLAAVDQGAADPAHRAAADGRGDFDGGRRATIRCDRGLMLRGHAGRLRAGEMLDWEAPTGGYLITGCLSHGPLGRAPRGRMAGAVGQAPAARSKAGRSRIR
jgi:hypothetical protein